MEITYFIAGKRFEAKNTNDLNSKLAKYELVTNLDETGLGNLTVRKLSDPIGESRYEMVQSHGDPADFDGYDICVGTVIANNGYGQPEVAEVNLSEIEKILAEVRMDIPDANLLVGSYRS